MKTARLQLLVIATMTALACTAQSTPTTGTKPFDHLELGVSAGSTGFGVDLAAPLSDALRLRTGFSYIPDWEMTTTFGIQVGDDPKSSERKFKRMSTMLESLTGNPVVNYVDMIGRPTMWNWSLLADVYPFRQNRHWRVTAGVFIGPSKVAETFNKTESMPSLMGVDIYNNMYNKLHGKSRAELPGVKLIDYGEGYEDLYTDPETLLFLQEKLDAAGMMGIHLGTYKHDITDENGEVIHHKGDDYVMMPDEAHMVKADMKVNSVKPYLGLGYDGRLTKRNERLHVGFDAGVLFWGGTPDLRTHDGTDLINDVENIGGKVGDCVKIVSKLSVMPVGTLRLTYTLF